MLLSDVQLRVTRSFGDTSGVQIDNTDIARWATDAQLEIVRKTKCNEVTVTAAVVAGVALVVIPNVLDVNRVELGGALLMFLSRNELDQRFPNRHVTGYTSDTPLWFTINETGVELFPTPVAGGTLTVTHNRRPVDVVNPGDAFEIPPQYHEDIVIRCLHRAYELDGQWQAADRKAQEFTARVAVSAAEHRDKNDDSYPAVRCLPGDYGGPY